MQNALVEVSRGAVVENVHHASIAVANAGGEVIQAWGDVAQVSFPRSAIKPLQAVPLIETGAAARVGLAAEDLALACASHHGEPMHIARVEAWLAALELDESALACGPALPIGTQAASDMAARGVAPARRFHNCSGKHCGFLSCIRMMGEPVEGYRELTHPAQARYIDVFSELLQHDAASLPYASDGCTLPAFALPLQDMARAAARFSAAKVSHARRADAIAVLLDAYTRFPEYASGTAQLAPLLVEASAGRCLFKTGADGYGVVYIPAAQLAVAVKVLDGNGRARDAVIIAALQAIGELDAGAARAIHDRIVGPVRNSIGAATGQVSVSLDRDRNAH